MDTELELFEDGFELENIAEFWAFDEKVGEAVVDGHTILGRIVGPFFICDGKSSNGRYYSRHLWEKVLDEITPTIKKGQLCGTVGHQQDLDDQALCDGKISHLISKLWIHESGKVGMGEALILNTPAGRNLNAYARAGMIIPISSRGYGKYTGKTTEGLQIVDPKSYKLESFDFVRIPGIPIAQPKLVEHQNLPATREEKSVERDLSNETLLRLTEDRVKTEQELTRVLESHQQVTEKNKLLAQRIEALEKEVKAFAEVGVSPEHIKEVIGLDEKLIQERKGIKSSVKKITEELKAFKALGTPRQIGEVFTRYETQVEQLKPLGSPRQIRHALSLAKTQLREHRRGFKKLGTFGQINAAYNLVEEKLGELKKLGSVAEIEESLDLLEVYTDLGTPRELKYCLEMMQAVMREMHSKNVLTSAKKLSESYGVKLAVARTMVQKMGEKQARRSLDAIVERGSAENMAPRYSASGKGTTRKLPSGAARQQAGSATTGSLLRRLGEAKSR